MKMGIKRCKLSRKIQVELLQFFIAEVTARTAATRTAANLVDINRHTATLYYHKIREVISYHLEQDSHYEFDGDQKCGEANWSWTRAILLINFIWFLLNELHLRFACCGGHRKGKRGRGAAGKVPEKQ